MTESLALTDSVRFIGKVDNNTVVEYLNMIDIFIVPSISSSETFGVAAIEASSCSIPVIASNIGGLPEVVIDGKTGYLVPPGDAESIAEKIIKLIEEPSLRQRLGKGGRKCVVDHYEWECCASKHEGIYNDVFS